MFHIIINRNSLLLLVIATFCLVSSSVFVAGSLGLCCSSGVVSSVAHTQTNLVVPWNTKLTRGPLKSPYWFDPSTAHWSPLADTQKSILLASLPKGGQRDPCPKELTLYHLSDTCINGYIAIKRNHSPRRSAIVVFLLFFCSFCISIHLRLTRNLSTTIDRILRSWSPITTGAQGV